VKQIRITVRVDKIKKVKESTKNTEKEYYQLEGKDKDGAGKVVLKSPNAIDGFKTDEVVDVVISTSQMSIVDFEGKKTPADPLSKKKKSAK